MNRKIRKRLVAHGHALVPPGDEPPAAAEKSFFDWFEQDVLGLSSEEYRRAFWREVYRTGRSIGPAPRTIAVWQRERGVLPAERAGDLLLVCLFVGGASLVFWLVRKAIRAHLNRVRRPSDYAAERARRLAVAEARRQQGRRATTKPCPSLDAVRALFAQVRRNPEAALRPGGLLEALECYLDNRPRFLGDRCLGRAGGIRRHLQEHAPDLFAHYSALMRYKAIAKRFRQAAGVADPVPADALLPRAADGLTAPAEPEKAVGKSDLIPPAERKKSAEILAADAGTMGAGRGVAPMAARTADAGMDLALEAARERAAEILAEGAGTVVALEAALALRLDPDRVPAMANPAAERTARTPPRLLGWLRRRRSA